VPEGVTAIPAYTFGGSTHLKEIVLPNTLVSIGSYAFYGCTSITRSITLPYSLTSIGNSAFQNCTGLAKIIWSKNLTSIGDYAFSGCTGLTNITLPDKLNELKSYAFSGCSNLLSISIPLLVTTIPNGVFSNCSRLKNIIIPSNVSTFGNNIFSGTPSSLTIIGMIGSPAEFYAMDNGILFEPFEDHISLITDDTTNRATINVSGAASADSIVKIYDGDTLIGTFTTSKILRYGGSVTLVGGYGSHILKAETVGKDGGTIFATKTVSYEEKAVRLTKFVMHHDGQSIDLITTNGIRQTLVFRGGVPFTFEVKAENSEQIKGMQICSERNDESKYMDAIYDAKKDVWLATGYFDANDRNYVPGTLSVLFVNEAETIYENSTISLESSYDETDKTGVVIKFDIDNTEISKEFYYLNETQKDVSFQESDKYASATINGSMQYASIEPVFFIKDNYGFACLELYTKQNNGLFTVQRIGVGLKEVPQLNPLSRIQLYAADPAKEVFDEALNLLEWMDSTTKKKNKKDNEKEAAREELFNQIDSILNANPDILTSKERYDLQYYRTMSTMTNMMDDVLPVFKDLQKTTTIDFGGGWIWSKTGSKIKKEADKSLDAMQDYADSVISDMKKYANSNLPDGLDVFFKKYVEKLEKEKKELGKSNGAYRVAVDPSGYIYEAVPSNRLPDVKVTAYYKEDAADEAIVWDASEYEQANPLYTDLEGRYAWDVPEGLWQVKAEKDGYQTTYSEWLPVPPPQTEVNIGIVSKIVPTVERVNGYTNGIEILFSKYMDTKTLTPDNISITQNDTTINGHIVCLNEEENPVDGKSYATIIRFVPNQELNGKVKLSISENVVSYADVNMSDEYAEDINIQLEPQSINADDVNLDYGATGEIIVSLEPAEAVAGMNVIAVSSDDFIAKVENRTIIDSNGEAVIPITAELPGSAYITLSLEGTILQTQIEVSIGLPKAITHQINATAGIGGTVSGSDTYADGAEVVLIAIPDVGYRFDGWYDENTIIEDASAIYAFIADSNRTLEARFVEMLLQIAPSAPTVKSKTHNSITLNTIDGAEYRCGDEEWQDSPTFVGLAPNTAYEFYARLKGTETHYPSSASEMLSVTTDKADQSAPSAPTVTTKTDNSVTLNTITNAEYRRGNGEWQDETLFTGLSPNTSYQFYARIKETDTHNASPVSEVLAVTTNKSDQIAPSAPTMKSKTSSSVTLNDIANAEYSINDGKDWQDDTTFDGLSTNTEYTFVVRLKGDDTKKPSPKSAGLTVTTDASGKQPQNAPEAPTLKSKTTTSITLNTIIGAEYRCANGVWQDSPTFTGLTANTVYKFSARLKETATHNASPASAELAVTTDDKNADGKQNQTKPSAPKVKSKTATSITLVTVTNAEYSRDGKKWQASTTFKGLKANTSYKFYVHLKATATLNASPISDALSAKTDKIQLAKPRGLSFTAKKASWKNVKNNNGYTLQIMEGKKKLGRAVQIKKNKTNYAIPKKLLKKGKSYTFTLVVKGKGNYKNSKAAKSKVLKIKK